MFNMIWVKKSWRYHSNSSRNNSNGKRMAVRFCDLDVIKHMIGYNVPEGPGL